jgi:hypothetical protein
MIILISYKLTPNRDYTSFFNAIKSAPATTWWNYIDNTWMVKTDETPEHMVERFRPLINDGTDTILIAKVDLSTYSGWLTPAAHEWIKANR